jgi:hypothetical protein
VRSPPAGPAHEGCGRRLGTPEWGGWIPPLRPPLAVAAAAERFAVRDSDGGLERARLPFVYGPPCCPLVLAPSSESLRSSLLAPLCPFPALLVWYASAVLRAPRAPPPMRPRRFRALRRSDMDPFSHTHARTHAHARARAHTHTHTHTHTHNTHTRGHTHARTHFTSTRMLLGDVGGSHIYTSLYKRMRT